MKKLFITIFIMILVSTLTHAGPIAGTTPRGTSVSLYDNIGYTDSQIQSEMEKYYQQVYTVPWTSCDSVGAPTNEYNCHGYAWVMTEGGTDACPVDSSLVNPVNLFMTEQGLLQGDECYYDDGSYNDVDSAYSTVIEYVEDSDHTAIHEPGFSSPTGYYYSKWAWGPLVRHLPNECPYDYDYRPYQFPRFFVRAHDIPYEHDTLTVARTSAKTSQTVYVYKTDNTTGGNYSYSSGFATFAVNNTNVFEQRSMVIYDSVAIDLGIGGSIQADSAVHKRPSLSVSYSSGIPTGLQSRERQTRGVVLFDEHVTFSPNIAKYNNADTVGFFGSVYGALNDTLSAGDSVYVNSSNAPLGNGNITDLSKITLASGASISAAVLLKDSTGTLLGYYSNLGDAVDSAQAGDTVLVNSNITLSENVSTNTAIIVSIAADSLNLNTYSIRILNGEIIISASTDIEPNKTFLKDSNGTILGCYSHIEDALEDWQPGYSIYSDMKLSLTEDLCIGEATTIHIAADSVLINSYSLTVLDGEITTDTSTVIQANIQLKDSTAAVIGYFSDLDVAIDSASTGDHVYVNSGITLSQSAVTTADIDVHFAENITVNLDTCHISVLNGEISAYTSTAFQPKKMQIRNPTGNILLGVYPSLVKAFTVNNSSYRIVCHNSDSLSTSQTIPMDIRFQNSATLTVAAGCTLSVNPDIRLEIYGTMSCPGTSANKILLTRNGSTGSWDGIYVGNGTTGGTITMSYTTVQRADNGVYLDANSTGSFQQTTMKYCDIGLYGHMASSISFTNNSWATICNDYGIRVHSTSDFNMSWSHSHNYNGVGLRATDGDGTVNHCTIRDCYQGIAAGSQILDLGSSCWSLGNNNFQNNRNLALALTGGDVDTEIDCYGDYWYNSGWSIPAGPTVNRGCDLTSPPSSKEKDTDTIDLTTQVHLTSTGDATEQLALARSLKEQGRYDEAYPVFKALLNSEELTGVQKGRVLRQLYATFERWNYSDIAVKSTDDMGILLSDILTANAPEKGTGEVDMYRVAMNLLVNYNVRQENIDGAIAMCETVIANYPGSLYEEMRLSDLVYFYLQCKGNKTLAESYLADLKNKYPESSFTVEAEKFFEMFTVEVSGDDEAPASRPKAPGSESPEKSSNDTKPLLPTEWGLEQNFPNPFNATTVIHYSVPEASRIKIVVINAVGQQVVELVNQNQEIGFHKVLWKANDVPSGLYFIRLTSPAYNKVQKAILLK